MWMKERSWDKLDLIYTQNQTIDFAFFEQTRENKYFAQVSYK